MADLEKLQDGRQAKQDAANPHLKYEKGALCQADGKNWRCRGRFVWALNTDGTQALLVGYGSNSRKDEKRS